MSFKLYIIFIPLYALLTSSCWSAKVTTDRKVDIESREIAMNQWQHSRDASWRLAIDDSIVWRRKTIDRQYDGNQQVINETITEETIEARHEENQESDEADDDKGENHSIKNTEKHEESSTSVKTNNDIGLFVLVFIVIIVCVYCIKIIRVNK